MVGKTILHYKIIEELGRGGMGVVYKAEDTKLERTVAIKFLPRHVADNSEERKRFEIEAKSAASLNHANIATIYSIDEVEDEVFIVMEYIEGQELQEKINSGPLRIDEVLEIALQIGDGLQTAHDKNIVHRDIKPANIMLTAKGQAKIMDFGLAKLQGQTKLTKEGTTLGTTNYMSPEQVRGEQVDKRSDIWALGVILYEMITGISPFKGEYEQAIMYSIINEEPEPITALRTAVPMELERIVNKTLTKNPEERYQSVADISVDLKRLKKAPPSSEKHKRVVRKNRTPLYAGLTVVLTLLIAAGFYWGGDSESEHSDDSAPAVQKLAVLPFTNIREDPQTDFLGFALADQIIGSLSYLKNILVRPSNSIRRYQNPALDRQTAGTDLQVDMILTGNYLKEANIIRLNIELIDVVANEMIWREPIEVEYENTFTLQDIVSEKIIDRLKLQFSQDERARMQSDVSQNPLAYEYYLRSLSYPQEAEGNRLAVIMLRQSIELDSTFAPAWDALGRRTQAMGYWELVGEEVANQAKDFYLKALEINPQLFSALANLTTIYTEFGNTNLAMKTARRMLEINPNSAEGMFAYGYVLRYAGMIEESMTAMTTALEIDPTNPTFRSAAWSFVQGGRYDDAIKAFYLGPPNLAVAWEGEIAIRRGQLEKARAKLSQAVVSDPEGITGLWATGVLSAIDGDYGQGIEAAQKWENANLSDGEGWYFLAGMYCINGEIDKCISLLNTAVERGYFAYPHMLKCRFLDPARGNPGLDAVLEKARLKHEAFKKKFFSE